MESLLDQRLFVYALLLFAAWVPLIFWWRTRKKVLFLPAAIALLLIGLFALLDAFAETSRRQIARALDEMSAGVAARNVDRIFRHIANDFRYQQRDRAAFRGYSETVITRRLITEVIIWDLEWPEGGTDRRREVHFKAKPSGGMSDNVQHYLIRATFVRESDGAWRMQGFRVSNPFVNTDQEIVPPQL